MALNGSTRRPAAVVVGIVLGAVVLGIGVGIGAYALKRSRAGDGASRGGGGGGVNSKYDVPDVKHVEPANATVTFNRDVAPIIFNHCTGCHHPGGDSPAPFPLAEFKDVRKRSAQIAEVVDARHMPPWMPSPDGPKFAGERRLTQQQIDTIKAWVKEGSAHGKPEDLTARPQWKEGWELGTPDLVLKMPRPFTMPADGKDVYRNFVLPVPGLDRPRWVRAAEMRPGSRVVHHAFTMVDDSGTARERDGGDGQPGYGGMAPGFGVAVPNGQFLSWQPGKRAMTGPGGSAWRLEPGNDVVVQLHMRPSGKPEPVQTEVALYFTDEPPSGNPAVLFLRSLKIDIPPGKADHAVETQYRLPADVIVTGVLPHAHYLGKSVEAWATLPNGSRRTLLKIDDWDFDWQGDYQYADPVKLPPGTLLSMRWTFDNSAANPDNPNQPPKRVKYGLNSTDEMAELSFQVLTVSQQDHARLAQHFAQTYGVPDAIQRAQVLLEDDPDNVELLVELASAYVKARRNDDAAAALHKALAKRPDHANAHYTIAHVYALREDAANATKHLKEAIRLDPKHYKAHNNLGFIHLAKREYAAAETSFKEAVRIAPLDARSHLNLGQLYLQQKEFAKAKAEFETVLKLEPGHPVARQGLDAANRGAGR